nr:MAG TPA: hypothetical protein [Caudoviricetes sp.]
MARLKLSRGVILETLKSNSSQEIKKLALLI